MLCTSCTCVYEPVYYCLCFSLYVCVCLCVYILCLVGAEPCRHHVCQPGASTLLPACYRAVSALEDLVEKTLIHFIIITGAIASGLGWPEGVVKEWGSPKGASPWHYLHLNLTPQRTANRKPHRITSATVDSLRCVPANFCDVF